MRRSRAALTLFLAMLAAALQTVGLSNIDRATAGDRRHGSECTRSWSPVYDCHAQAPACGQSMCYYDGYRYDDVNDRYEDDYSYHDDHECQGGVCLPNDVAGHCHVQDDYIQQPCGREAYVGSHCFDGYEACQDSQLSNDRELPAEPIEDYVYGDAANSEATTCDTNYCDDYGYSCDEFDCCLDSCRVHREDLSSVTGDARHSSGCEHIIQINDANDGLAGAVPTGYDYDEQYQHGRDFDCAVDECRSYACDQDEYLCNETPACMRDAARHHASDINCDDDMPFDLPPAEVISAIASVPTYDEYGYEYESDYSAYGYEEGQPVDNSGYDYGYDEEMDAATSYTTPDADHPSYEEGQPVDNSGYDYGYDEEMDAATSYTTPDADHPSYEEGYWNDEAAFQQDDLPLGESLSADLPPGEYVSEDDMPPAENVSEDDMPVGNEMPATQQTEVYSDFYEDGFYGDYSECDALHRSSNPVNGDCQEAQPAATEVEVDEPSYRDDYSEDYGYRYEDEYESYTDYRDSDADSSAGMSDDESQYVESHHAVHEAPKADSLRPVLRSAAWLLNHMGQALMDLSKSVDDMVAPVETVETETMEEVDGYTPWPSTIGRQPGVDCPLEL